MPLAGDTQVPRSSDVPGNVDRSLSGRHQQWMLRNAILSRQQGSGALVSTTQTVRETRVRVGAPARSDPTNTG